MTEHEKKIRSASKPRKGVVKVRLSDGRILILREQDVPSEAGSASTKQVIREMRELREEGIVKDDAGTESQTPA
jgi:hypothetical protein